MRKFLIGIAAATMLPMLALGQTPNTRTFVSSGAVPNAAATAGIVTIESCSVTPLTKDGEAFVPAQEAGVIVDFWRRRTGFGEEGTSDGAD